MKEKMKLDEINKDPFFKVPEKYFADFDSRLSKRLESKKKRPSWVSVKVFYRLAAVSAVVVIAVFSFFHFQQNDTNTAPTAQNIMQSNISKKQIIDYLGNENISTEEIADFIGKNDININDAADSTKKVIKDTLNSKIEDYLLNNGIDEQSIINSL